MDQFQRHFNIGSARTLTRDFSKKGTLDTTLCQFVSRPGVSSKGNFKPELVPIFWQNINLLDYLGALNLASARAQDILNTALVNFINISKIPEV